MFLKRKMNDFTNSYSDKILQIKEKIGELERSDAKTVPIIAMTANAFQEDAEKCIAVGMNAHLAKPLDIEKMKMTIKSICS